MLEKLISNSILRWAKYKYYDDIPEIRKEKEQWLKKKKAKSKIREQTIKWFGKTRYYFAYWFGSWTLYACNNRFYSMTIPDYQKFYKDRNVAERYEKRLQNKYDLVNIQTVFDKRKNIIGYMLNGKGQIFTKGNPNNIIPFPIKSH
jgi:hypothetical protein